MKTMTKEIKVYEFKELDQNVQEKLIEQEKKNLEDTYKECWLQNDMTYFAEELLKKYFGDSDEKHAIVQAMVEKGEIKKEEAWEVFNDLTGTNTDSFMMFLGELQEKLGCQVVRGTLVERKGRLLRQSS